MRLRFWLLVLDAAHALDLRLCREWTMRLCTWAILKASDAEWARSPTATGEEGG